MAFSQPLNGFTCLFLVVYLSRRCFILNINYRSHRSIGIRLSRWCASLGNFRFKVIAKNLILFSLFREVILVAYLLVLSVNLQPYVISKHSFCMFRKNNKHVNVFLRSALSSFHVWTIQPVPWLELCSLYILVACENEWALSTKKITKNPINKEFASQLFYVIIV